tara:strand:+ start:2032 stop:2376 length:345 start_codon:yes stop_codon:yes gene_type:complete
MIKLKDILLEILNTFQVEADLFVDKTSSHYEITNEVRALKGITIVNIITPEDYVQKVGSSDEYMRLKLKFVTRGEAKELMQTFLDNALAKDDKDTIRIQGIKSMKFRENTLKRI